MKIHNTPPPMLPATTPKAQVNGPAVSGTAAQDRITLDTQQLPAAVAQLRNKERELRADRLRRLAEAVQNGTYRPDPELIAARLVEASTFFEELDTELPIVPDDADLAFDGRAP